MSIGMAVDGEKAKKWKSNLLAQSSLPPPKISSGHMGQQLLKHEWLTTWCHFFVDNLFV
jgi:hypothetical protein